jgi:uncharacterized protein (TIGR03382 family)
VLLSNIPDGCQHVQGGEAFGPSVIVQNGRRIPSLILDIEGETKLREHTREIGKGLKASLDFGCDPVVAEDGGSADAGYSCPPRRLPDAGTVWIYETDSTKYDDSPTAKGRFDLDFGNGDRVTGGFVAIPCQKVVSGCSASGGSALLVVLFAFAGVLMRRRKAC